MTDTKTSPFMRDEDTRYPYIDLAAFGTALALELGFPVVITEPGRYPNVEIAAGDGLRLWMRGTHGKNNDKVEMYASCEGLGILHHSERPSIPGITVSSGRDMKGLAADVTRRLITPGRDMVVKASALVKGREATMEKVAALAASLNKQFPGLSIKQADPHSTYADVYFNKDGCYLTGSIDAEGKLSIQRFTVSTPEQGLAVLKLIAGGGK